MAYSRFQNVFIKDLVFKLLGKCSLFNFADDDAIGIAHTYFVHVFWLWTYIENAVQSRDYEVLLCFHINAILRFQKYVAQKYRGK